MRDLLAIGIRNLDADRRLAGDAIDQHRLGLHRQAEIVGEAGDLAVLHPGVRLELVGRDDRARDGSGRPMPSTENSRHFSSSSRAPSISSRSSILRSVFGRIEQRQRRERVGPLLALGRQPCPARAAAAARASAPPLLDRRRGRGLGRRGLERGRGRADHRGGARGFRRRLLRGVSRAAGRGFALAARAATATSAVSSVAPAAAAPSFACCLSRCFFSTSWRCFSRCFSSRRARMRAEQRRPLVDDHRADRGEQPAERELRRQDERQEEQRQDQDDRAGAIQVLGQHADSAVAHVAAGAEFLAGRRRARRTTSDRNDAMQPKSSAAPKALV